jgi:hypothetical protein
MLLAVCRCLSVYREILSHPLERWMFLAVFVSTGEATFCRVVVPHGIGTRRP